MFEARIVKTVVEPHPKGAQLLGVAEYLDEAVNFSIAYDLKTMSITDILDDLKQKIAEEFDIKPYYVIIPENEIRSKMNYWYDFFARMGLE